jgi:ornithine decarboxylase
MRARMELPVFMLVRRQRLGGSRGHEQVTGTSFWRKNPEFIARNLVSHLRHYAASLKAPFSVSWWTTPRGSSGPVGP